jgi:endonuclease G
MSYKHSINLKSPIRPGVLLLTLCFLLYSCSKEDAAEKAVITSSEHLALGNPSGAVPEATMPSNYLIEKPQYVLSYNRDREIPNWVSWHLDESWLGTAERQDDFRSDTALPGGWYRVQPSDYSGSGFDRGHNVPSADRTNTARDNSATFLMTNIVPQAPQHNRELWENLERYCRSQVEGGSEAYIIMGNYGKGGTGGAGFMTTIAAGKVTVPSRIWKVVVILPKGSQGAASVTTTTRVIAVDTPNSDTVSSSWGMYRTSVDAIEATTGYDLLSNVDRTVQTQVEARVDMGPTQ